MGVWWQTYCADGGPDRRVKWAGVTRAGLTGAGTAGTGCDGGRGGTDTCTASM